MEISMNNGAGQAQFRFENTKHKLGMQIWGDRKSFHELHELVSECWDCVDDMMPRAEECSYIGVISYFSYTIRHAFMGDRLVKMAEEGNKMQIDNFLNRSRHQRSETIVRNKHTTKTYE